MAVALKKTGEELTAVIGPDDRGFLASCPEVDVVAGGATADEAFDQILEAAIAYAEEYQAEFDVYAVSPNRAEHADYVRLISEAHDPAHVRLLFAA